MVKRVSSSQVSGGGNKIQLPGNVPAKLIQDVGRSTLSINKLIAPTILDLQKSEGRKVARQGIVDGQNGKLDPKLLFNPSFRGQAYTDNALSHYTKTLELQTRQGINDIIKENPRDSAKAEKLVDAFIQGKLEGMPQELRERTGTHYALQSKISANANLARIRKAENDLRIEEQQAVDLQLDINIAKEAPLNGASLGSDSFSVKQSGIVAVMRDRKQIEARYSAEISDGVTTIPAHSETEKITALAKYDKIIGSSMIQEQFRGQKDKAQYLRDFQLGKLEENFILKDDDGSTLLDLRPGPQARAALASGMKTIIRAENAEVKRRQAAVKGSIDDFAKSIEDNVPISPGEEAEFVAKVEQYGTEAQIARADNWLDFGPKYKELRTQTPVEIRQELIHINEEISKTKEAGEIVTPGMIERRDIVAKLQKEKQALLDSDPLAAGVKYGDIVDIGPLDTPQKMRDQAIQGRIVSEKYGTPYRVLNQNNLSRFRNALKNPEMNGDKLQGLLGTFSGFGEDKFQALSELMPDHPELAHLGALQEILGPSAAVDYAARGYVLQQQGTKNFSSTMKTKGIEKDILGDAYRMHPRTAEAVVKTAQAIYTATAFDVGERGGEFNEELYEKALKQAAGTMNLGGSPRGGLTQFDGGHKIVLPQNVSEEDFADNMNDFTDKDLALGGVNGGTIVTRAAQSPGEKFRVTESVSTRDMLDDGDNFLVSIGDGLYHIAQIDGNGKINYARGIIDRDSDNPGVRQGFYVLDYNKALAAKEARLLKEEQEKNKPIDQTEAEIVEKGFSKTKATVQKVGDVLGDFGGSVFDTLTDKLKSDPEPEPKPEPAPEATQTDKPGMMDKALEKLEGIQKSIDEGLDFSGKSADALSDLAGEAKDKALEGSAQITKGVIKSTGKAKKAISELQKAVTPKKGAFSKAIQDAKQGTVNTTNNLQKFGEELGEDVLSGLSAITKGVIKVGEDIREGLQTVKEFAEENKQEAKQLAKLVTKKARKLSNEASVRLFAKTVVPMIVSPGRSEGLPAPENVMTALVSVESSFRANQVSPQGAKGPAQILPGTAQDIADRSNLGFTRDEILNDPEKNIMGGMYYLYEVLLKRYSGPDRLKFAVAAYHGGLGNIDKARAKVTHKNDFDAVYPKLGPKTQNYVKKVMSRVKG